MSEQWWRVPVINRPSWTWEDAEHHQQLGQWWQHAVIYQIFPWSFQDSDDNGYGDLQGIMDRLDYIRALGVEAIWLNPIYPSKREDAGYDVTQFDDIDPLIGQLSDFKALLDVAHSLGLKVLIDQVWSHTSDAHPWFIESSASRNNPKADWYVWADAAPDGGPPNNWLSAFMGESAWCWHEGRQQYYLANFLPSQPDLNWHCDEAVDVLLEKARFWLDLDVDGFRIDAVNFFVHDPALNDNPLRSQDMPWPDGIDPENPMAAQCFTNSFCRPETLDKLARIRDLFDQYPRTVSLGEVTLCEDSIDLSGQYVAGDRRLHLAYNSALLQNEPLSAGMMREVMRKTRRHFPTGGQCWMVGNHDYQRLRSRWTGKDASGKPYPLAFYRMVAGLLVALPGALCLYQGDELGLTLAEVPTDIPPEKLQDPFGKALYPTLPGRDGSRTPMPWQQQQKHLGFTGAKEPWLPIPDDHQDLTIDQQNRDPHSLLNTWRRLLNWRIAQPALIAGDYRPLAEHDAVFGFQRRYAEQTLYCLFNVSECSQQFELPKASDSVEVDTLATNQETVNFSDSAVKLDPYAALFISYIDRPT